MSRTVCSWCKAQLTLKDDILVCSNTDCPACDEKYLHEELIRTRKALDIALKCLNGVVKDLPWVKRTLEEITELEQNKGGDNE